MTKEPEIIKCTSIEILPSETILKFNKDKVTIRDNYTRYLIQTSTGCRSRLYLCKSNERAVICYWCPIYKHYKQLNRTKFFKIIAP